MNNYKFKVAYFGLLLDNHWEMQAMDSSKGWFGEGMIFQDVWS